MTEMCDKDCFNCKFPDCVRNERQDSRDRRMEYYRKNKALESDRRKERYRNNAEKEKAYQKKYYEKHKDEPEFKKKNKENNRRWLSDPANLERKRAMNREYSRKRYAARKEAEMKIDLGKE